MTYRLKQLPVDTTVTAFLNQCGADKYSMVGRGKSVLDSTRYFASLSEGGPGTIVYYYAPDLTKWEEILQKLQNIPASLLIVNNELSLILEPRANQTILYCQQPKLLFARLVEQSIEEVMPPGLQTFDSSWQVGPNVQIDEGASIGAGARIEANCRIYGNVRIGNHVTIKANTVIGGQGFEFYKDEGGELRHFPHTGGVVIEDDVHIGSGVVIDASVFGSTVIGKGAKIDNLASIAHNAQIGRQCLIMANTSIAGSVKVGDRSRICLAASVRDGVAIGRDCVIGMNSCVTKDIPDSVMAYGVPASITSTKPHPHSTAPAPCANGVQRTVRIIQEVINRLQLDLSGLTVVTEAATGPFAVTASIAAVAGADVIAVGSDSTFGSVDEAMQATRHLAEGCGVSERVSVVCRDAMNLSTADIVTNLGFVRPLDQQAVNCLKPGCVIPLMYDAREIRPGEIDLDACRERGIKVVGTNEEHPHADILSYCGPLAAKLLFETGIEIEHARIAIAGDNFFTPHVVRTLERLRADVTVLSNWDQLGSDGIAAIDAMLFVDYWQKMDAARNSQAARMLASARGATVIQFVGGLDVDTFAFAGWQVTPSEPVAPHRMWKTLGYLGPRPVIELHAAGLKAAELELRGTLTHGGSPFDGLGQPIIVCQPTVAAYSC